MNLKQYLIESERTCKPLDSLHNNIIHMLLGMGGEFLQEFIPAAKNVVLSKKGAEIDIIDEGGDVLWYLAGYCRFKDLKFEFLGTTPLDTLEYYIGYLLEDYKKEMAYTKESNIKKCQHCVSAILTHFNDVYNSLNINIEDVLEKNIEKLKIRFPDKFESELAIHKNLEEEKKIYNN